MDRGHEYTDKRIAQLEKQLDRHYKRTSAEAERQLKKWLKDHETELNAMWERLDNGENADIDGYIYRQMDTEINKLVDIYVKADRKAAAIVGASIGAIYAYNYNDTAERIKKKTGIQIPLMKNDT